MLWRKLGSAVEAGLASERLVQSEWTKIVFSCPVPPHRRRSGPMPRPELLPRPITVTVRPLQFARRQPQRRSLCVVNSSAEPATKQEPLSPRATPQEAAVALANKLAGKGARAKSPKKSSKTPQTKSPRGTVRRRPLGGSACSDSGGVLQNAALSPRKRPRLNGAVVVPAVTPRQVVRAKSSTGQSISQKLMEPLPYDCRTLGENRSLPVGWRAPGERAASGQPPPVARPVEVNPMLQMTADEIAQHIASVRREGRFTSFEKVTDILSKLMSDPRNRHGAFNAPVDPVALQLPTYTTIVQHPMDLGTIKRNLDAGEYLELNDFVSDVRLVFENAMLFNPESHYIHVDAQVLLKRFNESVKSEQKRQEKRQRVQHACLVCRGNTCIVCNQQCLEVTQPHLQCSAGCSTSARAPCTLSRRTARACGVRSARPAWRENAAPQTALRTTTRTLCWTRSSRRRPSLAWSRGSSAVSATGGCTRFAGFTTPLSERTSRRGPRRRGQTACALNQRVRTRVRCAAAGANARSRRPSRPCASS